MTSGTRTHISDQELIDKLSGSIKAPKESDLRAVKHWAARLIQIEDEISDCERRVAELKKEREEVRVRTLPSIMFELGIDSVTIDNHNCTLEPLVQATLPKDPEQRQRAVEWLVDNGHGGIIKRELTVDLPKGDAVTENIVEDAVRSVVPGLPVSTKYNVHHTSYTALAKQLVRAGVPVPTDLLGVYVGSIVRVDKN